MNFFKKPGMVAEVCNPSYSGGNQDDLSSCGQAGQKLHKIPSQSIIWSGWYVPFIPTMPEAEIRRTTVQASTGKKVCKTPSQWKKMGLMVCAYYPSDGRKPKIGGLWFQTCLGKKQDSISKITRAKRTGGVAQAVEYLPYSVEA
jgi:hypothetical protein